MQIRVGGSARLSAPLLLSIAALAATYFVAGRLGLTLAFFHSSATAVWPPTGIALGAILVLGRVVWPGIAVGAFLVNLTTSGSAAASLGIAAGNTFEALAAAWLVTRYARGLHAFERAPDVVRFAALAGLLAPCIAATMGVTALTLTGLTTTGQFEAVWLTWWLGDAGGAILVAPPLILAAASREAVPPARWPEELLLVVVLSTTGLLLFGGFTSFSAEHYPLSFLAIPVLLWPAFRFGPRITSYCVLVMMVFAIWGTLRGNGPFGREDLNEALLLVQTFAGIVALTALTLAAAVQERRRLSEQLEQRVTERTEQLRLMNQDLHAEIARRQGVESALRASESRLVEAQAVAHVGSWDWDVSANRIWWSDELNRIYGFGPHGFPGGYEAFLEHVHPEDRQLLATAVARSLETGDPFEVAHRIIRPDGAEQLVAGRGRAVRDEGGKVVRLLGTVQDVTERKLAEDEHRTLLAEQAARRQAEEASRLKDRFLAIVSHELRTPINVVLGWARMLNSRSLDPSATLNALEIIERNAQAQAHLIDDLLDVSGFAAGQTRITMQPTDLGRVAQAAVEGIQPAAMARGIEILVRSDGGNHLVLGDPQRLQQVVWNLLSNAVKFTPDGGAVTLDLALSHSQVQLRVHDNGRGITGAHLEQVFEPFWQADTTDTRTPGGLGLGLAIVRHLVEAHGGTVDAASAGVGQGASFLVQFPHQRP